MCLSHDATARMLCPQHPCSQVEHSDFGFYVNMHARAALVYFHSFDLFSVHLVLSVALGRLHMSLCLFCIRAVRFALGLSVLHCSCRHILAPPV